MRQPPLLLCSIMVALPKETWELFVLFKRYSSFKMVYSLPIRPLIARYHQKWQPSPPKTAASTIFQHRVRGGGLCLQEVQGL